MNCALRLCRAMLRPSLTSISLILLRQTCTPQTCTHTHTNTLLLFAYLCFCVRFLPSQNIYKHRAQDFAVMIHLLCFSVRFQMQPLLLYFPSCCKPHGVSTIMTMIMARFYVFNLLPQKRTSHVLCRRCFPVRSWSRQGALQLMCILGLHETLFMLRSLSSSAFAIITSRSDVLFFLHCAVLQLSLLLLNLFPMHRN